MAAFARKQEARVRNAECRHDRTWAAADRPGGEQALLVLAPWVPPEVQRQPHPRTLLRPQTSLVLAPALSDLFALPLPPPLLPARPWPCLPRVPCPSPPSVGRAGSSPAVGLPQTATRRMKPQTTGWQQSKALGWPSLPRRSVQGPELSHAAQSREPSRVARSELRRAAERRTLTQAPGVPLPVLLLPPQGPAGSPRQPLEKPMGKLS